MEHAVRFLKLIFCLALLPTGLAFAQTTPDEVPATTAAPVAYVYVGTTKGVYLYDAASSGNLTRVSGSGYHPAGLAIGSNGKYFISLGTYYVHSYLVASNGGIGKQVSQINTQNYYGNGNCDGYKLGTQGMASLAHTGKYLYVVFPWVTSGSCAASIQTYDISSSGALTFNDGIMTGDNAGTGLYQPPTITANNTFAYAASDFFCCGQSGALSGYVLGSNGEMQNLTFNMSDEVSPFSYAPMYVAADPTNHLAALVSYVSEESYGPIQLASYTVDGQGNLSTTSTTTNMPYPDITGAGKFPTVGLNMSPSGKLLAMSGSGLQVFHFNGANPITRYSAVLTSSEIDEIHWDNSNHLYALSNAKGKLYVFTITPTSIKPVSGSPFTVGSSTMGTPSNLIVVSKVK
jgi:hypothetical protein